MIWSNTNKCLLTPIVENIPYYLTKAKTAIRNKNNLQASKLKTQNFGYTAI